MDGTEARQADANAIPRCLKQCWLSRSSRIQSRYGLEWWHVRAYTHAVHTGFSKMFTALRVACGFFVKAEREVCRFFNRHRPVDDPSGAHMVRPLDKHPL